VEYQFEWDPTKAATNARKHGITFERAATVFLDPEAVSVFDADHGLGEERWLTMGFDRSGILLVVCHTFREGTAERATVRIISSRRATRNEARQYRRG
jgi:uncharacterized DUF497 family protein